MKYEMDLANTMPVKALPDKAMLMAKPLRATNQRLTKMLVGTTVEPAENRPNTAATTYKAAKLLTHANAA